MLDIIYGTNNDIAGEITGKWFIEKQKLPLVPPYTSIAWLTNNNITGAAIFNDYTGSSIELHINSLNTLTRAKIRCIVNYVFFQLKCNILIIKPDRKTNDILSKNISKVGFKYIGVIPKYYGTTKDQDAILYYMDFKSASKWVK